MAAAIRDSLGVDSELIEGSGGIFDVRRDSELIFSKDEVGRFPEHNEILALLRGDQL